MSNLQVRHMKKSEMAAAVEVENLTNTVRFNIPGIGECHGVQPWAWNENDYKTSIRQYRDKNKGMYDTRAKVAISIEKMHDELSSTEVDVEVVVGSLVYEIHDEGFEILKISAIDLDTWNRLLNEMIDVVEASPKKNKLTYNVSDGDWVTLKRLMDLNWERKLVTNYFDCSSPPRDAWRMSIEFEAKSNKPAKAF